MDDLNFNKYKTKFCQAIGESYTANDRRELSRALDRALIELRNREPYRAFKSETLVQQSCEIDLVLKMKGIYCKTSGIEFKIAAVLPDWFFGWSNISKSKHISDIINSEFHFLSQYIFRAIKMNIIAALSICYDVNFAFFGVEISLNRFCDLKKQTADFFGNLVLTKNTMSTRVKKLIGMINCFDPNINRILYYYIEAKKLFVAGFWRSATTDLQIVVDSVVDYLRKTKRISGETKWKDVLSGNLKLRKKNLDYIELVYNIRNDFSAHPASAHWWDFDDIYDEIIEKGFEIVKKLVLMIIKYEKNNRIVEKNPSNWSDWYMKNAYIIFDVIGYLK